MNEQQVRVMEALTDYPHRGTEATIEALTIMGVDHAEDTASELFTRGIISEDDLLSCVDQDGNLITDKSLEIYQRIEKEVK